MCILSSVNSTAEKPKFRIGETKYNTVNDSTNFTHKNEVVKAKISINVSAKHFF